MSGRTASEPPAADRRAERGTAAASPFRRRTALLLATVGGLSLAAFLAFQVFGPDPDSVGDGNSAGGHRSAVGYRTLVELLETEVSVEPARGMRPIRLAEDAPLLVLEPGDVLRRSLATTLDEANNAWAPVVIVLPKWLAAPHSVRPGWAGRLSLVSTGEVAAVARESLTAVLASEEEYLDAELLTAGEDYAAQNDAEGKVEAESYMEDVGRQSELVDDLQAALEGFDVARPESLGTPAGLPWTRGAELPRPQLLVDPSGLLVPIAAYPEGLLIARLPNLPVYLVADPDLWNVAGLGRGDNGLIAHRLLLGEVTPGRWWVKEGRHGGLSPQASVWSALLRPPLALFTLQVALVGLLAVWIAASRFGRPRPAAPRVPPGKLALVENTARLLAEAGDPASAVERYLRLTQEAAAEALGLPRDLAPEERLRRLDRLGRQRGASRPLHVLASSIERLPARGSARRAQAVALAHDLYRWHQETVHGPPAEPRS